MPGPYPLPTLAATITSTGVTAPSYSDILTSLQVSFQNIYGTDSYLEPDSQDGQLLAVFAQAINDCNAAVIAAYNSFSPSTAVGVGLSSNVKLNGLQRESPSNSSVDQQLVGVAGTEVLNGLVQDPNDPFENVWALPASVTIPDSGDITVTAVCQAPGAFQAAMGNITKILNPTANWQSTVNTSDATPGAPVEDDAELRQRQSVSTALPAQTPLVAMVAQVRNLVGVQEVQSYENDTDVANGIGMPPHSVALVVAGGDEMLIAQVIANNKLGTGTFGTTMVTYIDQNGVPDVIYFSRPEDRRLIASVTVTPLQGYSSIIGTMIVDAMSAWVANLPLGLGANVNLNDVVAAAKLPGPNGATYKIEYGALTIGFYGGSLGTVDLIMDFDDQPFLNVADITIVPAL